MSAPFIVPFNFQPVSVSVKTTSYTIPSGKYAYVFVEVYSGGIFTINAVNSITSDPFLNIDYAGTSTAIYTVPAGYRAIIPVIGSTSTDNFYINGNTAAAFSAGAGHPTGVNIEIGPSGTLTSGSTFIKAVSGVAIPSNATHKETSFWLPTGTVLSGTSNWRATVMEYNMIS